MDTENRQHARLSVEGIEVYDPATDTYIGSVHNMTPFGLQFACEKELPEGHFHQIELRWEEAMDGKTRMPFDALSIWCEVIQSRMYCGVKILAQAEDIAFLEKLVVAHSL